jgi:hypothetical protein
MHVWRNWNPRAPITRIVRQVAVLPAIAAIRD